MNVTQDLSFLALISNAHLIVQLIMALLLLISLTSWTYIFRKMFAVRQARKQTIEFERSFWAALAGVTNIPRTGAWYSPTVVLPRSTSLIATLPAALEE